MKPGKDVFHFATIFYFKFVFKSLLNRLTSNNIIACHIHLRAHGGNFDTCNLYREIYFLFRFILPIKRSCLSA